MKRSETPMKIWVVVLVVFIGIQSFFYFFEKRINTRSLELLNPITSEAINDLKKPDSIPSKKVVIIGSSLVGLGVGNEDETTISVKVKPNYLIKLTKIWKGRDPYVEFVEKDKLFKKLKKIHPNLICIQSELVAIDLYPKNNFNNILRNLTDYTYYSKLRIYYVLDQLNIYKKTNTQIKPLNVDFVNNYDTINYEPKLRAIKKIDDIKFAFNDLKDLQNAGIKVVILDLPRPKKVEEKIYTTTFNTNLKKLLDFYKKEFNMDYWKYSGKPLYYKHFMDGGHMNKNGSEIYTNWLTEKINKDLN
jgi:hypothetical protein